MEQNLTDMTMYIVQPFVKKYFLIFKHSAPLGKYDEFINYFKCTKHFRRLNIWTRPNSPIEFCEKAQIEFWVYLN